MKKLAAVAMWMGIIGSIAGCAAGAEEPTDAADGAYSHSAVAQTPPALGRYEHANGSVLLLKKTVPGAGLTFALAVAGSAGAVEPLSDKDETAAKAPSVGWIWKKGACILRMNKIVGRSAMTLEQTGTCKSGTAYLEFAGEYTLVDEPATADAGADAESAPLGGE